VVEVISYIFFGVAIVSFVVMVYCCALSFKYLARNKKIWKDLCRALDDNQKINKERYLTWKRINEELREKLCLKKN